MSTANPLKRKSHQEATNAAPSAKKVKTPTPPAAVVSPPTPAAAVPAAGDSEAMEDVVSGNRKKRAHGTAKKKRAGRVSKHILDAAARKEAAAIAAAGEAEEKAIAQPAASGAASLASIAKAKVPPPKFSKATPAAAPTPVAVVESKVLALEYLRQWSNERAGWKFQKVRQQWLLDHVYEKDLLGKNDFATLCEYIKELKGAARTRMLDEARALVESYQEWAGQAEARAADREAKKQATSEDVDMKDEADVQAKMDADEEEEQSKKRKRKAQRAEKVLSVLA